MSGGKVYTICIFVLYIYIACLYFPGVVLQNCIQVSAPIEKRVEFVEI
jgi:hypothetical protein